MTAAWIPDSIEALAAAVRDGVLVEGHHVDFKRELTAGAAATKGLAKDLAAFGIDSGQIIIGVAETDDAAPTVQPVEFSGLKERVDQIARSAVSPPIAIRCSELPTTEDPTRGCLIVVVPASPAAPHQAGERFWGRGDTTNYVLSAVEVAALYERRAQRRSGIHSLLDAEIAHDPTPADLRALGHLFVVAQPETNDGEMFFRALPGQNFSRWVHKTLLPNLIASRGVPDITQAVPASRRARGWALHTYCISEERTVRPNGELPARENQLLDMEVHEDGGIRLFCARGTDVPADGVRFMDAIACGLVLRVVESALAVANTSSFYGSWQFGFALTNIGGAVSYSASKNFMASPTGFSEDSYRYADHVTYEELADDVVAVASKLVAPLLRGFQSPFTLHSTQ